MRRCQIWFFFNSYAKCQSGPLTPEDHFARVHFALHTSRISVHTANLKCGQRANAPQSMQQRVHCCNSCPHSWRGNSTRAMWSSVVLRPAVNEQWMSGEWERQKSSWEIALSLLKIACNICIAMFRTLLGLFCRTHYFDYLFFKACF